MAITPPHGLVAAVLLLEMNLNREERLFWIKKANFHFQIEVIYFGSQMSGLDVVVLITCK